MMPVALPPVDVAVETVSMTSTAAYILRETWSRESIAELLRGHLAVPDETINEALSHNIEGNERIKSLTITSKENGRLEIHADTVRAGRIELSGEIERCVHNTDESVIEYHVRERELEDHGLASWVFSRISLSMAQRMFGKFEISEDIPVNIHHNTVTCDFRKLLEESEAGQRSFMGHRLIDMVRIKSVTPHDGYLDFETRLDIPSDVRAALIGMIL